MASKIPLPVSDSGAPEVEAVGVDPWRRASQVAVIGLFVIALLVALRFGRPLLLPVFAAVVVGLILGPLADRAARYRIPPSLTNTSIIVAVGLAAYLVLVTIGPSLADLVTRAPEFGAQLREKLHVLDRPLEVLSELAKSIQGVDGDDATSVRLAVGPSTLVAGVVSAVTPAFAQFAIFLFALVFFLAGRRRIRNELVMAFAAREQRLRALKIVAGVEDSLLAYYAVVTVINLVIGLVAAGVALGFGLPNPLLWGFLAFALNYLPFIGPLIMKLMFLAAGLVVLPTLGLALLPAVVFGTISVVEANLVTPRIVGQRMTINPFLVFLAITFWAWLWGPVGAFLALPFLVIQTVFFDQLLAEEPVNLPG